MTLIEEIEKEFEELFPDRDERAPAFLHSALKRVAEEAVEATQIRKMHYSHTESVDDEKARMFNLALKESQSKGKQFLKEQFGK